MLFAQTGSEHKTFTLISSDLQVELLSEYYKLYTSSSNVEDNFIITFELGTLHRSGPEFNTDKFSRDRSRVAYVPFVTATNPILC